MKKKTWIVIVSSLGVLLALFLCFAQVVFVFYTPAYDQEDAKTIYRSYSQELNYIAHFLEESYTSLVTLSEEEGTIAVHLDTGELPLEDMQYNNLMEAFSTLYQDTNCHIIEKRDGIIYFQFWATLDEGKGIAYCLDAVSLPQKDETGDTIIFSNFGAENIYYYEITASS